MESYCSQCILGIAVNSWGDLIFAKLQAGNNACYSISLIYIISMESNLCNFIFFYNL